MNRFIAACLVLGASAALAQDREVPMTQRGSQSGLDVVQYEGRAVVAGELLVKFRDGNAQRLRRDAVRMRRHRIAEARDLGHSGYSHVRLADRHAIRETIASLSLDADVEYVEPNYIVEASATPNDTFFSRQWALKNTGQDGGLVKADIDAATAWEYTKGAKKTVVGIVDSGIDYTHPDLAANVWSASKEFTVTFSPTDKITCPAGSHGYNAITNSCDPRDNATHGTAVAGTVGATGNNRAGVSGVAWTTTMMGLAFLDSSGRGNVANAIRAIEFAIQAKKALGDGANIRVLNNSWGGAGYSQALLDEINKAASAGMLFIAAAGNTPKNLDAQPEYPAAYTAPNLITVAATDNKDVLATFSTYGAKSVHIGAPGIGIATTSPAGQYVLASGTSFSAPLATGVAALVLAACETLDVAGLRKAIVDNVDPVPGLAGKTSTGGRLNAYKAIKSCATSTTPQVPPGFSLAASPLAATLNPGTTATMAIQLTAKGGFAGPVALTITGLPAGVTGVFIPASITPGQTASLRLTAAANAAPIATAAAASIKGVNGSIISLAAVSVAIKAPPSFDVTATPPTASIKAGAAASYTLKVTPVGGFSEPVMLQVAGLPAGSSGQLTQPTPGTLVLSVRTTATTVLKSYPLTVTATGGSIRKTVNLTLTVTAK